MEVEPKIDELINGYLITWPAPWYLSAQVSRLRTPRDGQVRGELEIRHTNGTKESVLLVPTQFNFSSELTRAKFAEKLKDKIDLEIEWREVFDYLSQKIQELARGGEPAIEITTAGDIKPPEYLVYPLIVKKYSNVIFGDPSSFKTTIAVILTQVVILPWHDNPMGLAAPDHSIKVLYLDWETDAETIQWQTVTLQRGIEHIGVMGLHYRHCAQPLTNDLEEIRRDIADIKAELVIIDSQGLAAGGELKETQSALGFYAALRRLKVTSLILAHNSKDRESKTRSIYGNQFFTAQARNISEVRKNQEPGSNEIDIALFHRKSPPFAGLHRPLGFKIVFDNDVGTMNIKPSDPKTVGEFLEQMGLKSQILEALKSGSMTVSELSEMLDKPANQIKARCNELKKKGKLVKIGESWGLANDEL